MRKTKGARAEEIRALKRMNDRAIDTSDIPPTVDWSKAVVGRFYRPIKKPLTIRLDADVLCWLKGQGKGYQTRINSILRTSIENSVSHKASLIKSRVSRRFVARLLEEVRRRGVASSTGQVDLAEGHPADVSGYLLDCK